MQRFITFTEEAQEIINECFELAEQIWGGDYSTVRVLAGNYAGYGKYLAHYIPMSHLIEFPLLNHSFGAVELTHNGIEIKNKKEFMGTMLHELGHHYVNVNKLDLSFTAGDSTHSEAAWCYVCATGWNHFYPELDITPEKVANTVVAEEDGIKKALEHFSPYNPYTGKLKEVRGFEKVCVNCENDFISRRSTAKYCSNACKLKYNRKRKKAS